MRRYVVTSGEILCVLLCLLALSCGARIGDMAAGDVSSAGPQRVEGGVLFVFHAPKAERVAVVGDFNNWSTTADPMYDRQEKGEWSVTLPLKPGQYEYKFLVDGEKWTHDPGNPKRIKDGFGAYNSIVEVKP